MSLTAARQLWLALSVVAFLIGFNLFAVTQGWGVVLKIAALVVPSFDRATPLQAALYGACILPVLLLLAALIGAAHARQPQVARQVAWAERVPVRYPGVSPASGAGRVIAALALVLFTLLPLYETGHFARKILRDGQLCYAGSAAHPADLAVGFWATDWHGAWPWNHDFRLAQGPAPARCEGDSFQPFLQPLLWVLVTAGAVASSAVFLLRVARRGGPVQVSRPVPRGGRRGR